MTILRLFTSLIVLSFGFLLSTPLLAIQNSEHPITLLSSGYTDICSTNITCEKTGEGHYKCGDIPETLTSQGMTIHQISSGKGDTSGGTIFSCHIDTRGLLLTHHVLISGQKEVYIFPFVGSIKIQV